MFADCVNGSFEGANATSWFVKEVDNSALSIEICTHHFIHQPHPIARQAAKIFRQVYEAHLFFNSDSIGFLSM